MSKRFELNRRAVLRGLAGSLIGLPLLEYTHGKAWAQAGSSAPPKRFIVFFAHGGTLTNVSAEGPRYSGRGKENGLCTWKPAAPGEALELGICMRPVLQDHVGSLTLVRGVNNEAGKQQSEYNGGHGWNNVTALSAGKASRTGPTDDDIHGDAPSIDQVLAARLQERSPTLFPSVNLYVDAHNYGSPFFRAARQGVSREPHPRAAFDKLFANVVEGGGSAPDPAVVRLRAMKRSVLDGTGEGLRLLNARMSSRDKQTVAAHLEHIRELERRLDALAIPQQAVCTKPGRPVDTRDGSYYYANMGNVAAAHVDLMVAALKCGLTNVISLEMGDMETCWLNPSYHAGYHIGHSLHHDGNETGEQGEFFGLRTKWYESMLQNQQWRLSMLKRFLDGMQTPEGDGTMLDNSLVLYTSEFSAGGAHSAADVPLLLAGKAAGRLRGGRHYNYNTEEQANPDTLKYKTRSSTHNLFTSILNMFDYPDTHFGSEHASFKGPLPGLV